MRFRIPKLLRRKPKSRRIFAWWPRRTTSGTIVWLEPLERIRTYNGQSFPDGGSDL